ncbi:hypothetical protein I6N96_09030 [Enterococcus sp. BWM-S5]|uniref:Methyltransferase n=1 Tax=Enterococcus larvae TaxID=2794352 RepID=A0ABS4CIH6_9ENTE|nr:hypothetical protein [Enterococcus larvae]MBP1046426.1 hypothetical protein [Enterococcus larvae]
MTEEIARILLSDYFEKNNLDFLSTVPINDNGERVTLIEFGCDRGTFYMKLSKDLRLLCQNRTRTGWIRIKNY